MELTREQALKLHRQMWTDMQRDLGDCPTGIERVNYKEKWCEEHFLTGMIANDCFLCEYAFHNSESIGCNSCPIIWGNEDKTPCGYCCGDDYDNSNSYHNMPISQLLALPEREISEDN